VQRATATITERSAAASATNAASGRWIHGDLEVLSTGAQLDAIRPPGALGIVAPVPARQSMTPCAAMPRTASSDAAGCGRSDDRVWIEALDLVRKPAPRTQAEHETEGPGEQPTQSAAEREPPPVDTSGGASTFAGIP